MYDFAIVVLMGIALFKVVDLLEEFVPSLTKFHLLLTLVLAVAGVLALDYSVFANWGVEIRNDDLGTVTTGLMIAGTTSMWRAAFHWLGTSEGEEPDVRHHRPRIAA
ncbi:MAG TPA: hypothetical protein VFV35_02640 [Acidimicrobiales bacterium]|nr:hypothetical protein [Acidimicrobiales bacterium]